MNNNGNPIGTNLYFLRNRPASELLIQILDPNRDVDPAYLQYTVELNDGSEVSGMIVEESAGELSCGVALINLQTGNHVGSLKFSEGLNELYDIQLCSHFRRPNIMSPQQLASKQAVSVPGFGYWLDDDAHKPSI